MSPRGGKRPGAGRPPGPPELRGVKVMFYLPRPVADWLRANVAPGKWSGYVAKAIAERIEREKR